MVKKVNRNESFDSKRRSRRMNEGIEAPPYVTKTVGEIKDYIKQIDDSITDEDIEYYIQGIEDHLYGFGSLNPQRQGDVIDALMHSVMNYKEAIKYLRYAEEDLAVASNTIVTAFK